MIWQKSSKIIGNKNTNLTIIKEKKITSAKNSKIYLKEKDIISLKE